MQTAKHWMRGALGLAGLENHRKRPQPSGQDPFQMQLAHVGSSAQMIFDLGAHHGGITLVYRSLFPAATIHAFEPFPGSCDAARKNTSHDPAIHVHQLAVSDRTGQLTFHSNTRDVTNSLLPTEQQAPSLWGTGVLETVATQTVETVTLDEFCDSHQISQIDILKLDVQGAEYRAFQGAHRLLSEGRVRLIYSEIIVAQTYDGQRPIHEYFSLLAGYGYHLTGLFNVAQTDRQLMQLDAVFVRRQA
jgi:FkbM family methyltransferase